MTASTVTARRKGDQQHNIAECTMKMYDFMFVLRLYHHFNNAWKQLQMKEQLTNSFEPGRPNLSRRRCLKLVLLFFPHILILQTL